MYRTSSNN